MHGIISLLPAPHSEQVRFLWKMLEDEFGLIGVRATPIPHFSWQIAQEYDFEKLKPVLAEIAGKNHPFLVRTAGIGLFTGPRPVLYISIIKSAVLLDLHQCLWEQCLPLSNGQSPYYSPLLWMPHITLAFEDLDEANIAAVVTRLGSESFSWEFTIDSLSLYQSSDEDGKSARQEFPLKPKF